MCEVTHTVLTYSFDSIRIATLANFRHATEHREHDTFYLNGVSITESQFTRAMDRLSTRFNGERSRDILDCDVD